MLGIGLADERHDRGHQVVGRLGLGDLVEVTSRSARASRTRTRIAATIADRVLPLPPRPVRVTSRVSGSCRVLGKPRPGRRDRTSVCAGSAAARRPAAPPARRDRSRRAGRLVAQDGGLDPLQRLAGLDAELSGEHGPRLGVDLERFLGAVAAGAARSSAGPTAVRGWGARGWPPAARRLPPAADRTSSSSKRSSTAPSRPRQPLDTSRAKARPRRRTAPVRARDPGRGRRRQRDLGLLVAASATSRANSRRVDLVGHRRRAAGPWDRFPGRRPCSRRGPGRPARRGRLRGRPGCPTAQPRPSRRHVLAGGQGQQCHQRPLPLAHRRTRGAVGRDLHRPQQLHPHGRQPKAPPAG